MISCLPLNGSFITGTFLWDIFNSKDVDIVVNIKFIQDVDHFLNSKQIGFEIGKYYHSYLTEELEMDTFLVRRINFIFLNDLDFLKWRKGTELMSLLNCPKDKLVRHAVFEMLCSISALTQHDIKLKSNENS
jgi:hypothetical protein